MEKGLLINNITNLYYVKVDKIIYECSARGKFKNGEISPVVGDYVAIEILDSINYKGIINEILDRKNYLKRPKLANITQIVLVVSAKMPVPDLWMLDKQLLLAEFLKIKPIIVINKIDLADDEIEKIKIRYEDIGYLVIKTNAKTSEGVVELIEKLKGNISGFAGNSGVGKSSLINSIFDANLTLEGEISSKNKKGKNTTTNTKLYEIDNDTYIVDTPGFSTFEIDEIKSEDLAQYFLEFKEFIAKCEFVGCTHIKEENCGIKNAIEAGKISEERYYNYLKLYNELKEKEKRKW